MSVVQYDEHFEEKVTAGAAGIAVTLRRFDAEPPGDHVLRECARQVLLRSMGIDAREENHRHAGRVWGRMTMRGYSPQIPKGGVLGGFSIGDRVEKFTGEARWGGTVVSVYWTTRGALRYVVEVEPQGFQMIAVGHQLRAILLPGEEA